VILVWFLFNAGMINPFHVLWILPLQAFLSMSIQAAMLSRRFSPLDKIGLIILTLTILNALTDKHESWRQEMKTALILAIGVLIFGYLYLRRLKLNRGKKILIEAFEACQYRDSMDRIINSRSLNVSNDKDSDQLMNEVVSLSSWIGLQARRNSKFRDNIDDDTIFVSMLFSLIATDYLSKCARISFESSGALACLETLWSFKRKSRLRNQGADDGLMVREVIDMQIEMLSGGNKNAIIAIGSQVGEFFATDEDARLKDLGGLFDVIRNHIKTST
jgi:hypothetical protein